MDAAGGHWHGSRGRLCLSRGSSRAARQPVGGLQKPAPASPAQRPPPRRPTRQPRSWFAPLAPRASTRRPPPPTALADHTRRPPSPPPCTFHPFCPAPPTPDPCIMASLAQDPMATFVPVTPDGSVRKRTIRAGADDRVGTPTKMTIHYSIRVTPTVGSPPPAPAAVSAGAAPVPVPAPIVLEDSRTRRRLRGGPLTFTPGSSALLPGVEALAASLGTGEVALGLLSPAAAFGSSPALRRRRPALAASTLLVTIECVAVDRAVSLADLLTLPPPARLGVIRRTVRKGDAATSCGEAAAAYLHALAFLDFAQVATPATSGRGAQASAEAVVKAPAGAPALSPTGVLPATPEPCSSCSDGEGAPSFSDITSDVASSDEDEMGSPRSRPPPVVRSLFGKPAATGPRSSLVDVFPTRADSAAVARSAVFEEVAVLRLTACIGLAKANAVAGEWAAVRHAATAALSSCPASTEARHYLGVADDAQAAV